MTKKLRIVAVLRPSTPLEAAEARIRLWKKIFSSRAFRQEVKALKESGKLANVRELRITATVRPRTPLQRLLAKLKP